MNSKLTALHSNEGLAAAEPVKRRNQRSVGTRNAILSAAVRLYQLQGIENTSISAVIEQSGVGRTTFYRHFKDRDDVLNHALKRDFEALMQEFTASARYYERLEEQIEEDMIWFLDQFAHRSALSLLFTDIDWHEYQQSYQSIHAFRDAAMACATPTYERAKRDGRLREGVSMEQYIDWTSFVVVSMRIVKLPALQNRTAFREMLRNFLVPSLIKDQT